MGTVQHLILVRPRHSTILRPSLFGVSIFSHVMTIYDHAYPAKSRGTSLIVGCAKRKDMTIQEGAVLQRCNYKAPSITTVGSKPLILSWCIGKMDTPLPLTPWIFIPNSAHSLTSIPYLNQVQTHTFLSIK